METIRLTIERDNQLEELICDVKSEGRLWQAALTQGEEIIDVVNDVSVSKIMDAVADKVENLGNVRAVMSAGIGANVYVVILNALLRIKKANNFIRTINKKLL